MPLTIHYWSKAHTYHLPPFDKIKDEHFVPRPKPGCRNSSKKPMLSPNAESFIDNTVVGLANGTIADGAANFSNLNAVTPTDPPENRDRISSEIIGAPVFFLNNKLFARIQELYSNREKLGLDPESSYLLERYYKDFVRAGAKLSDPDKEKLKKINAELATLQTQFDQSVLKEKNTSSIVVDRREDLAGLSDNQIAAASAAAKDEHKEGKFDLRLQNTTGQPVLGSLQNRALRERIMQASLSRDSKGGPFDTREIIIRTAQLRAGAPSSSVTKTMPLISWKTRQPRCSAVNKLLADLRCRRWPTPAARQPTCRRLSIRKRRLQIASWDCSYSEKVQSALSIDESDVRPTTS